MTELAVRRSHSRRRPRLRRRRRLVLTGLSLSVGALALSALAALQGQRPLLVYNASASAPIGLYRVLRPSPLTPGALVLARTPASVKDLAAERGYLPRTVPLVKRVAAVSGDCVCGEGAELKINGRLVARPLKADRLGRPLSPWRGCRRLAASEVLLLMPSVRSSFDGRYFGPTQKHDIIGRLLRIP